MQWCIAKNGGGYTQTGVAKGLKVPCLFMITEVSIRCQKNPEVGIRRIPAYTPNTPLPVWSDALRTDYNGLYRGNATSSALPSNGNQAYLMRKAGCVGLPCSPSTPENDEHASSPSADRTTCQTIQSIHT